MLIGLYCCLLVRVQLLSLIWADLHHTDSLWALFQGSIVEFRLGYPIFYLGTSKISPSSNGFKNYHILSCRRFVQTCLELIFVQTTISLTHASLSSMLVSYYNVHTHVCLSNTTLSWNLNSDLPNLVLHTQ